MTREALEALADRFFAAVEAKDTAAATALYDPAVRIWHSRDEAETGLQQNREVLDLFFSRVDTVRYRVVRREFFPGGFLQEHVVEGVLKDGASFRLPVGFLCRVDDEGRIVRIAEYCDGARSPLRGVDQGHGEIA
jgi:ketosteroid isomerase-like protein